MDFSQLVALFSSDPQAPVRTGLRFAVGTHRIADITLQVMGNLVDSSTPGAAGMTMRVADRTLAAADPVLRKTRAKA